MHPTRAVPAAGVLGAFGAAMTMPAYAEADYVAKYGIKEDIPGACSCATDEGQALTVRLPRHTAVRERETLALAPRAGAVHLFDLDTGKRLNWTEPNRADPTTGGNP